MLDNRYQRGFSTERLANSIEPRVRQDERGYYIMSISENTKVYFEDYYRFLEAVYLVATRRRDAAHDKLLVTDAEQSETQAFYRARLVICDIVLSTVRKFYCEGGNFGVIMTPWCFGTVVLEKIEVYRDRLNRGEVHDANIEDYPYYVVRYIEEIYRAELLELFDFPEKAFEMRWQYSELLRRYSRVLTDITGKLNRVLTTVKNFGA